MEFITSNYIAPLWVALLRVVGVEASGCGKSWEWRTLGGAGSHLMLVPSTCT